MGFFSSKATCHFCNEDVGLNRFRLACKEEKWICGKCFKKCGFTALTKMTELTVENCNDKLGIASSVGTSDDNVKQINNNIQKISGGNTMSKMKTCKVCGKEIAASAKACPECGAKNKKPFYLKWWVWAIVLVFIIAIGSSGNDGSVNNSSGTSEDVVQTEVKKDMEDNIPTEYKSALKKAKVYSDTMHMSKQGIYDQLTSEYGEQFSAEAGQYAIDNLEVDYKVNALKKAETYQNQMNMSPEAIRDQLASEHGEKFTQEEADYAIEHLK